MGTVHKSRANHRHQNALLPTATAGHLPCNESWSAQKQRQLAGLHHAGDIFYDCKNLDNILQQSRSSAIQFKSAIKRPKSSHAYTKIKRWDRCHQALIYRKSNHQKIGGYSETLKICSDSLFIKSLDESAIEYADQILSITQVSPKNASRNPSLVREDLEAITRFKIDHQPWGKPLLTLTILRIEAALGSSTSVWMLCHLGRLFSKYQKIDVSD